MEQATLPEFRIIESPDGPGVTYVCGCPCTPTATPSPDGQAAFEHCCCGKVHFAGANAEQALTAYLAERKAQKKREPDYQRGVGAVAHQGAEIEVAWAFPLR